MKNEAFTVGQLITRPCAACGDEQTHTVAAATKLGTITKMTCSVCNTTNTFKSGVKTATSMTTLKTGTPYDQTRSYRKGQTMLHSTFGRGEVTAVVDSHKIDVLFGDSVRRLIHARS